MARTQKTKLLIWVTALALVMACVPSFAAPAIPTIGANTVNTFIAQTANAAATQTALVMPSPTTTPTITPIRNTETPSPTATSTVIFILSTRTPIIIPTFTSVNLGGSGSSSDNYACQITKVSPPNGSVFGPRADFDTIWTVKNIGKKKWDRTSVDYIYSSGAKIHKVSGYDLSSDVNRGSTIGLGVDMRAPKASGTYTTTWTMRVGSKTFCPLSFTIVVK
ncbi:MAG TPA: NBR1-Ig-like domain-containing protein [Anaerolineales bacterium]|nr:NBR1-Ig-like domain-containing protein [Anaerolineales bacterium]